MNRAGYGRIWNAVRGACAALGAGAESVQRSLKRCRPARRLRLSETLSLGEKRFLAVVEFQHQEFLVGGTGNSIALLARLDADTPNQDLNNRPIHKGEKVCS